MIRLQNISLRQGPNLLLNKINWTIYSKQRIGLIGANGSGKTTLLSLLSQNFEADTGQIEIPKNFKLAYMAQEMTGCSKTALDFVLDGDEELRALENALEVAIEQNDGQKIASLHEKIANCDGYTARARAAQLLYGLGFSHDEHEKLVSAFSGGWRVRLNLARTLMQRSDMLLLDEPTNHLDLDAVFWFEEWLKKYPGTLLIISHDRDFLDETVDHIAHISNQQLKIYAGNYSAFEKQKAEFLLQQQSAFEKQQQKIAHLQTYIDRFRAKASKAKQAQSRIKAIERMEIISAVQAETPFEFEFKTPKKAPNPLITVESGIVGYDKHIILKNINLTINPKARIALLGPNGAGKSTLIKLLAAEKELMSGNCFRAAGLKIGYFAQHQVDQMNLKNSAILHLQDLAGNESELTLRKFLGCFGFSKDKIFSPVETFSGGEKSRLALALIVWQEPNLLLLDEPTNHLDLEMRNALSFALQTFEGAMILVSHDRFLVKTTTDQLMLVANQKVELFDGDLNDYQKWLGEYRKNKYDKKEKSSPVTQQIKLDIMKNETIVKNLNKKLEKLEEKISHLQNHLNKINEKLFSDDLYTLENKMILDHTLEEQIKIKNELMQLENKWLEISHERELHIT